MSDSLLFDTDVLIDYLRGYPPAIDYFKESTGRQLVSVITVAELFTGVRDGNERHVLEEFLSTFQIVSLNQAMAVAGGQFRRAYLKSHGVGIADALIAATAQNEGASLVTFNGKHFPMFDEIVTPYQKTQNNG